MGGSKESTIQKGELPEFLKEFVTEGLRKTENSRHIDTDYVPQQLAKPTARQREAEDQALRDFATPQQGLDPLRVARAKPVRSRVVGQAFRRATNARLNQQRHVNNPIFRDQAQRGTHRIFRGVDRRLPQILGSAQTQGAGTNSRVALQQLDALNQAADQATNLQQSIRGGALRQALGAVPSTLVTLQAENARRVNVGRANEANQIGAQFANLHADQQAINDQFGRFDQGSRLGGFLRHRRQNELDTIAANLRGTQNQETSDLARRIGLIQTLGGAPTNRVSQSPGRSTASRAVGGVGGALSGAVAGNAIVPGGIGAVLGGVVGGLAGGLS